MVIDIDLNVVDEGTGQEGLVLAVGVAAGIRSARSSKKRSTNENLKKTI